MGAAVVSLVHGDEPAVKIGASTDGTRRSWTIRFHFPEESVRVTSSSWHTIAASGAPATPFGGEGSRPARGVVAEFVVPSTKEEAIVTFSRFSGSRVSALV